MGSEELLIVYIAYYTLYYTACAYRLIGYCVCYRVNSIDGPVRASVERSGVTLIVSISEGR